MDATPGRELYRIGDLILDAASKTLYRSGKVLPIAYRSAQLLLELARNHPNVVRRIDLIESVWPREDVTDQALSQRISLLRKELGDTADEPRYIGRVWGWGYHLVASVERLPDTAPFPKPVDPEPSGQAQKAEDPLRAEDGGPLPRVAVLGFRNESSDAGTNWLEVGLSEAVTHDLARRRGLRVTPRQLVLNLVPAPPTNTAPQEELSRTASLLGVDWLAFGTYTRVGTGLRIDPALCGEGGSRLLRLPPVEGSWKDLFSLQDQLVECLLDALQVSAEGEVPRPPPAPPGSIGAFEAYTLGKKRFLPEDKDAIEEAQRHFERATTLDPSYAMAHSGLGATQAALYSRRMDPKDLELATQNFRRALELDPEITEPYPWLSYVLMRQGRFEDAIAMGRKGVDLQPDFVYALYFLGLVHLVHTERKPADLPDALRFLQRATEVDPRFVPAWHGLTCAALATGDYAKAEGFNHRACELERGDGSRSQWLGAELFKGQILMRTGALVEARQAFRSAEKVLEKCALLHREAMLGLCACGEGEVLVRLGSPQEALPRFRRAWQLTSEFPRVLGLQRIRFLAAAGLASAYALTDVPEKANELAREATQGLQALGPESWIPGASKAQIAYEAGIAWRRIGNGPAATACLEAAVSSGWRDVRWLEKDPELSELRRRSGFLSLLSRASKPLKATDRAAV